MKVGSAIVAGIETIFTEIVSRYEDEATFFADAAEIDRWGARMGVNWLKSLDVISAELAKRYHSGLVSYEIGDAIANDLWGALIMRSGQVPNDDWPTLCQNVYFAFDAGEYRRKEDGDADPVELYTSPAIDKIVVELA